MAKSLPKLMQWISVICAGTVDASRTPASEAPTIGAQMLQIDSKGSIEAVHQDVVHEMVGKPPCASDVVSFDFLHAKVLANNLGGQGPRKKDPPYIRLGDIGNFSGELFDLKIETTNDDYYAANSGLNHARGHTVQVNVGTTKEGQFKFTILKPGSDDPVTLPAFYISVFDIDQSGLSGEQVFVKGYDDIIIPEDIEYDVEDTDGGKTMTSKKFGRICDNPTDPWNLSVITCFNTTVDTRRRSFTMLFQQKSSFELTFRVLLLNPRRNYGKDGRNLLFAGPSGLTEPCVQSEDGGTTTTTTPPCDPKAVVISFKDVVVTHNNLGGIGPDGGVRNVRYSGIANLSGDGVNGPATMSSLDLLVETLNDDFKAQSLKRVRRRRMGVINVAAESEADMKFTFVWSGTNDEVVLPAFYITVLDVDTGAACGESVTVSGFEQLIYAKDHEFDVEDSENGTIITATKRGNGCDNPNDPMHLPVIECKGFVVDTRTRTFTMLFKETSSFRMAFRATVDDETKMGKGGRNLLFTGMSSLTSYCEQSDV